MVLLLETNNIVTVLCVLIVVADSLSLSLSRPLDKKPSRCKGNK